MLAVNELAMREFLDYWGMARLPFPKNTDPSGTFMNTRMEQALKRMNQLLYTREIGVVIGEAGNGKTTLMDVFLSRISSTQYKIIPVPVPQNKPRELYRSISSAMGVNTSWFGADALKVVDLLTYSFIESNRPNLILIDEAHILSAATLNELRLLTNTKVKNESLITLILFGQPSLSSTLKLPSMIPLAQRVGAWISLGALTEEESLQYLDWHTRNAGAQRELFSPAAKKAIYRQAQGNPRMMNRLAWESMNQGCLDGAEIITEELFAHVCKNLGPHLGN